MTIKRMLVLLTAVALMMAMAVAPAFAQTDLPGLTWGGNCLVNDFVEICDLNTGQGGV